MTDPAGFHGIDIGGTKIELASYDAGLREVHRERIATPSEDIGAFTGAVCALVRRADDVLGTAAPVGVGLPGVTDGISGRQLSSNVPALNGRAVRTMLQDALARPVAIGNDCQCFALSEADGGAADGLPSMVGVILGTGAGGGYCVDGHLQRGRNGIAGEWGHWPLPATLAARHGLDLVPCPCGRTACLERYVSGPGMRRLHRHLGGDGAEPYAIAARAGAGDQVARRTIEVHLDLLAHGLACVVLGLDPHAIVLGGGLSNLPHLYRDLPQALRRHLFAGAHPPPVLPPLFGDAGGVRGAALLIRQQSKDLATP